MQDRFKFRIPMFTDKGNFQDFQYLELGEQEECTLCGYNGEPQQCTGLKDNNGKLIYEGDILKQPDGIIDYVYWSDGCYIHNGTAITNYDVAYQGDNWAKEVNTHELIGNIYENPELLED